jgi:23S rRNA pseudouridine1911/1915/1917 synthase
MKKFKISEELAGQRLDKFLQIQFADLSRSKAQELIKTGFIKVSDEGRRPSYILSKGDVVSVRDFSVNAAVELVAEDFDLEVVYEDDSCMVINKPAGVVVHPGEGNTHTSGTVVNKVLSKLSEDLLGGIRPGIVHRLDQDTSGLMIIAKTKAAYDHLVDQFKERSVKKNYLTLVCDEPEATSGIINSPIGRNLRSRKQMAVVATSLGKEAITEYHLRKSFVFDERTYSLLDINLKTGRTHQIRVHVAAIGHPVVADPVYGNRSVNKYFKKTFSLGRQFLHAYKLSFISPETKNPVSLEIGLPDDLNSVLSS